MCLPRMRGCRAELILHHQRTGVAGEIELALKVVSCVSMSSSRCSEHAMGELGAEVLWSEDVLDVVNELGRARM